VTEPRIAVYLRVSTEQQSHDSQRLELEQYCERRSWKNVQWFEDIGSGAKQDRAKLNQLMQQARRGRIDVVVAFKLDRLARSLNHLAQIVAELQSHSVALVCPSQGIDTTNSNPCAQFQLNILAAVAQFERELIRERVNAGLAAAKQRGVKLGRPAMVNQRREDVKKLMDNGQNAAQISRTLRLPYSTTAEIVRELKSTN
jgi:DNA invertase Pin-like site-specific DNA recombinase